MKQQINLYKYLKQTPTYFLTFNVILIIYAVFAFFLFIDTGFDIHNKKLLDAEVQELTLALDKEKQILEHIKLQYPSVNLEDLEGSMQRLKQELNTKSEIAAILAHQTLFSSYLTAFSNAVVKGVWLTDVNITKSGKNITLNGQSVKANFVDLYLERLKKQPLFSNMEFTIQEIAQNTVNEKGNTYFGFTITGEVNN